VEICNCNTSTKRSSNLAPFEKIRKSGDGEGSGDTLSLIIKSEENAQLSMFF
jgi:hypothetical protein